MADYLTELLNFDVVEAAEQLGASPETMIGMQLLHTQVLVDELAARGDTQLSNKVSDYVQNLLRNGFECVYTEPFIGKSDEGRNEALFLFANPEIGALVRFDTYGGSNVNAASIYYCWKPHRDEDLYAAAGSGRVMVDQADGRNFWVGNHDARQAFNYNLQKLREKGTFYRQWPAGHKMFLWLLHYADPDAHCGAYQQINIDRLRLCPDWVKKIVNIPDVPYNG